MSSVCVEHFGVNTWILRNMRMTFLLLILVIFTIICYKLVMATKNTDDVRHKIEKPVNDSDTSCYNFVIEDDLPLAETEVIRTNRSIFFIDTTCRGYLTARQACSVESASRSHHNWTIYVLFLSPVTKESLSKLSMKQISNLHNVNLLRMHLNISAVGTPIHENIIRGDLNQSIWTTTRASDVRFLILHKWGGIYLDLDVVIAKQLDTLGENWATRNTNWSVSPDIIYLSSDALGQRVAEDALKKINNDTDDEWGHNTHNGSSLMTSVIQGLCGNSTPELMSAEVCGGFQVYGPEYFYPVQWENWKTYFNPDGVISNTSYGYHVWSHESAGYKVHKESPYAKLANNFCPTVFNMFKENF